MLFRSRLTYALGKELEIPVVSGSDTHQAVQYGCVTTVFERDVDTVPALYGEMTAGRYAIDLSDTAAFQVRTACLLKRSLKEIHALGGDYVAILTLSLIHILSRMLSESFAVNFSTAVTPPERMTGTRQWYSTWNGCLKPVSYTHLFDLLPIGIPPCSAGPP